MKTGRLFGYGRGSLLEWPTIGPFCQLCMPLCKGDGAGKLYLRGEVRLYNTSLHDPSAQAISNV